MGDAQRRAGGDDAIQPAGGWRKFSMSRTEPAVFVVDDDVSVRESLRNLLRSVGLKVETFSTAQDFLSVGSSGPGCLVLDVRLPGLSGLELQRQLAETNRDIAHCPW